jgi:hypothetical protein
MAPRNGQIPRLHGDVPSTRVARAEMHRGPKSGVHFPQGTGRGGRVVTNDPGDEIHDGS